MPMNIRQPALEAVVVKRQPFMIQALNNPVSGLQVNMNTFMEPGRNCFKKTWKD